MKKLYRTEGQDSMIFGVCGGIAEYFELDPSLVRLVTAALVLVGGMSLWVYIIAAFILPKKSEVDPGF